MRTDEARSLGVIGGIGTGRYNLAQGTMATMRSLGATASGLSSQLIVEHLGYPAAFSACGIIGAAAAVLLWLGLPPAEALSRETGLGQEGVASARGTRLGN